MDPRVAKKNAQAEERLKLLATPALRPESMKALDESMRRAEGRYELIKTVAQRHGIDPDELFAKYVIETRKSVDPENPGTSSAGASGPFQLMPNTRSSYTDATISDPFERDADAAARLMADLKKRNDYSPDAISVAYNYGEGRFRNWGGDATQSLPDESTNYLVYSRYLRPRLREQAQERTRRRGEMEMGLLEAKASVPAPEYKKQDFIDYLKGEPSPTDVALAEHDRQVKAKQDAVRQRYPEFQ